MEQFIRNIIQKELKVLFEARRNPPKYTIVDADDCLPKNEVTPYQVLKKSEYKCQTELAYIDAIQMNIAHLLIKDHIPAEERIRKALELIYRAI